MRNRVLFVAAVALVALVVGVLASLLGSKEGDRSRLNEIAGFRLRGDHEGTQSRMKAYLEDYPEDALGWTILGNSCRDLDSWEEAAAAYARALAIDERQLDALVGQGVVHRHRGALDQAEARYEDVLAIDPTHAQAHSSLTTIALKRGHVEQALEHAKRAFALDKEDAVIAANLAVAWHYAGNAEKRDELTRVAEELGYRKVARLRQIYAGELTVMEPAATED